MTYDNHVAVLPSSALFDQVPYSGSAASDRLRVTVMLEQQGVLCPEVSEGVTIAPQNHSLGGHLVSALRFQLHPGRPEPVALRTPPTSAPCSPAEQGATAGTHPHNQDRAAYFYQQAFH